MGLGGYFHYTFDFILVSVILAGIKSTTGYELAIDGLAHTKDSVSFVKGYLQIGEKLFSWLCSYAKSSGSFRFVQYPGTQQLKDAVNMAKDAMSGKEGSSN